MPMVSSWHEDTAAYVVIPLLINIAAILAVFARLFPGLFEDRPLVSNNLFWPEFDREPRRGASLRRISAEILLRGGV